MSSSKTTQRKRARGTMLIYDPGTATPEASPLQRPPSLPDMQRIVGGYIEAVPFFDSIEIEGKVVRCVVFVNEEGKLSSRWNGTERGPLAINRAATLLWEAALQRVVPPRSLRRGNDALDVIAGPALVLTGDDDFMEAL
ncbi:MAG TPA: hypothetical protein VK634_19705 [Reyranella sp.]|nr:hypothetical protein [Reyranella sp.]HTE82921.1 hypothetical protein [Reyranella sp.]